MTNPDPVLVQHYAVLKGISHEEARNKLRDNYEVEVKEIPLRDLVLRTLTGMRAIAPKVDGMANRENGTISRVNNLENKMESISRKIDDSNRIKDNSLQIQQALENLEKEIRYLKLPWYRKPIIRWQKKRK